MGKENVLQFNKVKYIIIHLEDLFSIYGGKKVSCRHFVPVKMFFVPRKSLSL